MLLLQTALLLFLHVTERKTALVRLQLQHLTFKGAHVLIICRAINSMDGSWVELLYQSGTR